MIVYWANLEDEWVRALPPDPVSKSFYQRFKHEKKTPFTILGACPVFNGNLINLYNLRSIYSYEFRIEEDKVVTDMYTQEFFDKHVNVRDLDAKMFGFVQKNVFFTEEESLLMSAYEFPNFEDNNITKRVHTIPGKFDIGKWFRPLEFAFYLRDGVKDFKIEQEEVYCNLRFHTEEKIEFKQFRYTEKLSSYLTANLGFATYTSRKYSSMNPFYNSFKLKNKIIQEIKENLV